MMHSHEWTKEGFLPQLTAVLNLDDPIVITVATEALIAVTGHFVLEVDAAIQAMAERSARDARSEKNESVNLASAAAADQGW